jgi:hypothetical protein
MGAVPASASFGPTNTLGFAIALYESGNFEVIFTSGRKDAALKATVGATSHDGKVAVLAAGPDFDYPAVGFGGDDDVNYRFTRRAARE